MFTTPRYWAVSWVICI